MKKEEFERLIRQMVPHPDVAATEKWYAYGRDMNDGGSDSFLRELASSFGFIAHHFSTETVQKVYEIIGYGTALPSEMVAAAVYLQNGDTPQRMAALAEKGHLMCFHQPKTADEASPLALVSVTEAGKTQTFYTLSFGRFQPEEALRCAKEYAADTKCSIAGALRDGGASLRKKYASCRNLYTGNDQPMTQAMSAIFKTCPAIAVHITINADTDRITMDYNPLWQATEPGIEVKKTTGRSQPHRQAARKGKEER